MDEKPSSSPALFAAAFATAHSVLWILFILGMVTIVPGYQRTFMEWNLMVPVIRERVFATSKWLTSYWFLLIPVLPLFFALNMGLLFLLRRKPETRSLGFIWATAMIATPLLLGCAAAFGIWTILENVLPGISK